MMGPELTTRTALPDAAGSRAVLIGVWDYQRMASLPAVENNVDTLRDLLTDVELWGLPDSNCMVVRNPRTVDEALDAIHEAAIAATEALVVYFAGHGLLDDKDNLYLALADSDRERLHKAVRFDDVRRQVIGAALRCRAKIVILDCCYSGQAMQGAMGGQAEVADRARIDGTYLMTASPETSPAWAPPGERYTAFTGALIGAMRNGLPDGSELIGMDRLYWQVRADLEARMLPAPQQRARNDGNEIALVRNRWGKTTVPAPRLAPTPPEAPPGLEGAVRLPPGEFVATVGALRDAKRHADADRLLIVVACRRGDQEIAAILVALRRAGHDLDAELVIRTMTSRSTTEIVHFLDTLRDTDQPEDAALLLRTAAARPAPEVAALAVELRDTHVADLATLSSAMLTGRDVDAVISLAGALTVVGLRAEVIGLLGRAAEHLPVEAAFGLADSLWEAGQEQAALPLYLRDLRSIARRPAEMVARLIATLTEADQTDDCVRLTAAAISARVTSESIAEAVEAFHAARLDEAVRETLDHAATILTGTEIGELAELLRSRGLEDAAFDTFARAAGRHPASQTIMFLHALRAAGRPIDAIKLLENAARDRTAGELVSLIAALRDHGENADAERLLKNVMAEDTDDLVDFIAELDSAGAGDEIVRILQTLYERSPTAVGAFIATCSAELPQAGIDTVLLNLLRFGSTEAIATGFSVLSDEMTCHLFVLAAQSGDPTLTTAYLDALRSSGAATAQRIIDELPAVAMPVLLAATRQHPDQRVYKMLLAHVRSFAPDEVASAALALRAAGQESIIEKLIDIMVERDVEGLVDLIKELHRQHQSADASLLVERVARRSNPDKVLHLAQLLYAVGLGHYARKV